MSGERVYLGIDGGGSKTEAIAIDSSGAVLGVGLSGKSNYQTCGMVTALKHIREAAEQALAGKKADEIAYCLAGADTRLDFIRLEPELRAFDLGQDITIYNDVLAVFRAGSSQPYGMGVVCGTGFNAGGISQDRREFRLPALGEVTGDFYGGGGWLGMTAMGYAFRGWDGRGTPTQLADVFLKALGMADMETLAEQLSQQSISSRHIHDLVPLVFETANRGDEVARQLIRTLGQEIGITIVTVLRRLDLLDCSLRCRTWRQRFLWKRPSASGHHPGMYRSSRASRCFEAAEYPACGWRGFVGRRSRWPDYP